MPDNPLSPRRTPQAIFGAILAGAKLSERLLACLGVLIGIATTGILTGLVLGDTGLLPLIVPPIGASAVLVFVVPASPLAQPWPVIGGNSISAAIGIAVAALVPQPALAATLAVALAILTMSLTRSLHPPGGAAALMAALGGGTVAAWGPLFPLMPVLVNSALLVGLGIAFHRLGGHSYPHVAPPVPTAPAPPPPGFVAEDIDAALASLGETFDIDRADLDRIIRQVEIEAAARQRR